MLVTTGMLILTAYGTLPLYEFWSAFLLINVRDTLLLLFSMFVMVSLLAMLEATKDRWSPSVNNNASRFC